jgi:hypothetical protein
MGAPSAKSLPAVMNQAVLNRSFKPNNMDLFASTSKKLPDAMVVLTATAVRHNINH